MHQQERESKPRQQVYRGQQASAAKRNDNNKATQAREQQ